MPSQRDYMIATVLGEDNLGTREGQAAIIDSIFNRQNAILSGKRTPGYFEAKSSSIQDIVTANRGNQYNTWKGTPEEAGNAARAARALQGREATSGREREQYDQIAKIYDEYMAGEGGWQGISQGATFYQTPKSAADGSFQNKYYSLNGGNNYQDIGSHRFSGEEGQYFKDKNAFYQANPQLYNPNTGAGFDPSSPLNPGVNTQGPGDFLGVGLGDPSNLGRPYETGGQYGFSGGNFAGDAGNGAFNLGGAYPNQDVNPLAFGSAYNVGGGRPGAFSDFLPPVQTGDPFAFTGLDTGGGVAPGSFGTGVMQPGPAPDPFGFSGANMAGGVGNGAAGQLPAGFDPAAYLRANPELAAAGVDPAQHYRDFGSREIRALTPGGVLQSIGPDGITRTYAPDGTVTRTLGAPDFTSALRPPVGTPTFGPTGTPTIGGGTNAFTIGAPAASGALPASFNPRDYVAANADLAGMSDQQAIDHFQAFGRNEVRALAPWLEASVYGAPAGTPTQGPGGLSPTYQPPQPTQTFGPGGTVDVMSAGLVPTQGAGATVQSFSPGGGNNYLTMPSTVATTIGAPDARGALPPGFDAASYVAANADLFGMSNQQAAQHFLDFGQFEQRALAPWLEASVYAPPGLTPTQGPTNTASTIGAPGLTATYPAPDPIQTLGPPALTGTYGPPATTPTLNTAMPTPSWSPFGGMGISNPFGFSAGNFGGGLGAGPQSFGSIWPAGDSYAAQPSQPTAGPDMSNPFGFTSLDASGFDAGALGGGGGGGGSGGSVNEMGISGGFDSEGAMRRVLEQQAEAIRLADLAAKTPMHANPNAWNAAIANGGTLGLGTAAQTPGAVGGPVVPNLTVSNMAAGRPSAGGFGGGMPFVLGMPFAR